MGREIHLGGGRFGSRLTPRTAGILASFIGVAERWPVVEAADLEEPSFHAR